ncbi:unnamed protein product [Didymodactylos carnosus]|uniref:Uncharacterized protein n=1 Tax=Didymodactylos carnosus TaxID=1234261 RepID=A0A814XDG1_9BILA|nr:unnamed protein product [Didymodactylos carnosus]CAF3977437.1 unnamed protein product [Didymodactylos carnosus]
MVALADTTTDEILNDILCYEEDDNYKEMKEQWFFNDTNVYKIKLGVSRETDRILKLLTDKRTAIASTIVVFIVI